MKFTFLLGITLFYVSSCNNAQNNKLIKDSTKNNMPSYNDLRETRKYSDTAYYTIVPSVLENLQKNGYKFPNKAVFKSIVLKIFNIDIDTAKSDCISSEPGYFIIFPKDGFILDVGSQYSILDSLKKWPSRNNNMFLQFNNYLFNNSPEARYLLAENKPPSIKHLLFRYGYIFQDSLLNDALFKADTNGNVNDTYKNGSDFYEISCITNHDGKIAMLNEKMLNFLASKYPEMFDACADLILYQDMKAKEQDTYPYEFVSDLVKYHSWAYVLNTFYVTRNEGGVVDAFFVTRGEGGDFKHAFNEFKKYNYFGFKELEDHCNYVETLTPEKVSSGKFDN